MKASELPPNLRRQLADGRARPPKARTLAAEPEPTGGANHWTCVPCGLVFTQWGGKGGVETHVTDEHGGGRIALDVGGAK